MTQDRLVLDEKNVALLCALLDGQVGERRRTNGQLENLGSFHPDYCAISSGLIQPIAPNPATK